MSSRVSARSNVQCSATRRFHVKNARPSFRLTRKPSSTPTPSTPPKDRWITSVTFVSLTSKTGSFSRGTETHTGKVEMMTIRIHLAETRLIFFFFLGYTIFLTFCSFLFSVPIRNHACQLCSKTFLKVQHLQDHLNTHLGVKLHPCQLCDKKYSSAATLKSHQINVHQLGEYLELVSI